MVYNLGQAHSVAPQILAEIRSSDVQKDRMRFQFNLERLGTIMAYEISRKLNYHDQYVTTPLGKSVFSALVTPPVLITVMRAGIPYWLGFQKIFDHSETGFIGAYRKEGNKISVQVDYTALPDINHRDVILIDPMLATGQSMTDTVKLLQQKEKYRSIHLAALITSPEGLEFINQKLGPEIPVWTFAIDEKLNPQSYIVPGLGDAGDLSFGEKK